MSGPLKTCGKCLLQKPGGEFYENKKLKSGLDTYCKECRLAMAAAYRIKKGPEFFRKYDNRTPEDPTRVKDRKAKWRAQNMDMVRANLQAWKASNIDKVRESNRKFKRANKDKLNAQRAESKARGRECLSDTYVNFLLDMPKDQISKELTDLKRITVQIKRELKKRAAK